MSSFARLVTKPFTAPLRQRSQVETRLIGAHTVTSQSQFLADCCAQTTTQVSVAFRSDFTVANSVSKGFRALYSVCCDHYFRFAHTQTPIGRKRK